MAAPGWRDRRDAVDSKAAYEKREKRRNIRKLQEAIDDKNITTVQEILKSQDFDVDFRYRGQTALQLAVRLGALDICKLLIERGANVDEADGELNSLLNTACWNGYEDISTLLIDNNANLEAENDAGSTPLHACAKKGHARIAGLLVAGNCNLNVPDRLGRTATMVAAQSGNAEVVGVLVKAGADLDWVDQHHRTPLMIAADLGFVDIVHILITGGANCNLQDDGNRSALLLACMKNHLNITKMLLEHNANPDLAATRGTTPLLEAIRNNNFEIAHLLLDAHCDINKADRMHQAPLHEAIRQVAQYFDPEQTDSAVSLVKRLVAEGADLNAGDNHGWRPIYQTAYGRNFGRFAVHQVYKIFKPDHSVGLFEELTELLLKSGADLNVLTATGDMVMHGAVYGNNLNIVNFLIKAGCSVNGANVEGQNPLLAGIVARSNIEILSALVEAGTDLNLPEHSAGHTPLHEAIHQYYNPAAKLLIDSGCDLTVETRERLSPLCMASKKGNETIVAHLLAALPRPLIFTTLSAIPLHAAAKQGHAHIIKLLALGGCDVNQLNIEGKTPLQEALTQDNFPAARHLLQVGCNPNAHASVKTLMKCCLLNDDPHPHFALEPLFQCMTHRNFDLMRMLLQCYYVTPIRVIRLLKNVLKSSRELAAHFNINMRRELATVLGQNVTQPKLLQDVCRRKIRACLGFPVSVKTISLPLAEKLKDYIAMKDVFEGWEEDERLEEEMSFKPVNFGWRGSVTA